MGRLLSGTCRWLHVFFLLCLAASAAAEGQDVYKVTLVKKRATLETVFRTIKEQTGLTPFYSNDMLDDREVVSAQFSNADLSSVMNQLLEKKDLTWFIRSRYIIIQKKPDRAIAAPKPEASAVINVRGLVTDEKKQPLPGVSITEKGTQKAVVTDNDGRFIISVAGPSSILVFSYIGFVSQEVAVNNQTVLNVTLKESVNDLETVVVVGYGTVKKTDLTGSVSSVKAADIKALPSINAVQSLTGRSAGVQVIQASGAPGTSLNVRIRGGNSLIGGNEPLYVVDGFALSGSPTILDPSDIESMEVLKDASATAIYGSRGANGVVIITTKSGKAGSNTVSFDSYLGFQQVIKRIDMLNATQFAQLANERARNDGVAPFFTDAQISSFGTGTNWQDAIFRTAPIQNHSINFSGGSDKTRYSVSGSFFGQDGIVQGSGYNRGSIRSTLSQNVREKLKLNLTTVLSRTQSRSIPNDNQSRGTGVVSAALDAPPTIAPRDANGNYSNVVPYSFSPNSAENPLALANEILNKTTGSGVLTNLGVNYEFIKGLTLKVSAGVDYANAKTDFYSPRMFKASPAGTASTGYSTRTNFLNENILNYNKTFGIHALDMIGGVTYQSENTSTNSAGASGFTTDILQNNNLSAGTVIATPQSSISQWRLLSGLFRTNYTLNGRYLFTASIRADGSSRFGESNKWGYFPSGAVGWRISEEEFLKNSRVISNLKLRTSWGQSGNTAISPYQSLNVLSGTNVVFGDNLFTGFAPANTRPNPDLKWETTTQTNVGIDAGFFRDRLRITADYYVKNTNDLLGNVPQASSTGYDLQVQNIGKVRNSGIELELGGDILTGAFKWDASANFAANRNKAIRLANGSDVFGAQMSIPLNVSINLVREQQPIGVFYGFKEDGLDAAGRIKYQDLDGNGVINNLDRTIIGNPNPDFIFGLNNNFSYKNFSLNIFVQGVQGLDIFNFNLSNHANAFNFGENQVSSVLDRWTPENPNPNAKNPKISVGSSFRESDRFVEDGSFIRLKNVRLAYSLPVSALNINWMKSAQIFVSGQNLATITKYSWYDPEVSTRLASSAISLGIDQTSYPVAKIYTFGLSVGF